MESSKIADCVVTNSLSVNEFAELAGINASNARDACKRCHEGGAWRGHALQVRKDGKSWQVKPSSLPPALYSAWLDRQPKPPAPQLDAASVLAAPMELQGKLPDPDWIEMAKWIEELIQPALVCPKRSRARGAAIKEIADRVHVSPTGKARKVSNRTVCDWIDKYEAHGLLGLVRKRRNEQTNRVTLSRKWDDACPLPHAVKSEIAEACKTYIKSVWAAANPGWKKVEDLTANRLVELCRDAGWEGATKDLCKLGRHAIEAHREFAIIHTKKNDAKRFYDLHKPRIIRDHSQHQPMEVVIGDVHPVDVLVTREDGSIATPRAIAWYDMATHRMFVTLALLEKGQGVTQADVWASFAAMVEAWGFPEHLYLDNGSEYDWAPLIRGFNELSALVINWRRFTAAMVSLNEAAGEARPDDAGAIIRALPYNAAAKPIEGAFASLEKVLSMLPGYIGGDRMNKRTPKLGKQAPAWPSFPEFQAAFDIALQYWNGQEQDGNLAGRSPNQALADAQAEGWRAVSIPREALIYALSEALTCKVHNTGIKVDGDWYDGPVLSPLRQSKVQVRYAKWAPDRLLFLPCYPDLKEATWIDRAPVFHALDPAGAAEQSRKEALLNRHIAGMAEQVEPLDMAAEIARAVANQPEAPEVQFGPAVSLGAGVNELVEAGRRDTPAPARSSKKQKQNEREDRSALVISMAQLLPPPPPAAPEPEFLDPITFATGSSR